MKLRHLNAWITRLTRTQRVSRERNGSSFEKNSPPVGGVQLGGLRRVTPISQEWGYDRGLPIDRYYIEIFLSECAEDIRERVLEIKDDSYTRKFGGGRVTVSDVLDVDEGNAGATVVADLTCADRIPSEAYDCIILTQTLQFIYDVRAALETLHRILKPGGVLLATFPGITRIQHDHPDGSWFWSFTSSSARRLFEESFPAANISIRAYGNVLVANAFLYGLATEELRREELDHSDPDYEVLIAVRAAKGSERLSQESFGHLSNKLYLKGGRH